MLLSVGKKYPIEVQSEFSIYLGESGFLVTICFPNLSRLDVEHFKNNELNISFCKVDKQIAFFNFSIDEFINDCEVAFSIVLTERGSEGLKCADNNSFTNAFTLALVEEEGKELKALRAIGIPQDMAKVIYETSLEQEKAGLNNYEKEVFKVQNLYSPTELKNKFKVAEYTFKK